MLLDTNVDILTAASRSVPRIRVNEQDFSTKEKEDLKIFKKDILE